MKTLIFTFAFGVLLCTFSACGTANNDDHTNVDQTGTPTNSGNEQNNQNNAERDSTGVNNSATKSN